MERRLAAVLVIALLALATTTACSPRTPDADTWRDSAQRAVGDAHAALQSARVGLEQALQGRVFAPYLQTVAVDAEAQAGSAASTLASFQPPESSRKRYTEVTTSLDDAASLLADVRIAVVAGHEDQYPSLLEDLKQAANGLHGLERSLRRPGTDAPGGTS